MVYLIIVCLLFVQSAFVFTDLCVLEPLVTISRPVCVRENNCSSSVITERRKRDISNHSYINSIPLVPLGSPSSAHFESVDGGDDIQHNSFISYRFADYAHAAVNIELTCDDNYKYRTIDGSCNNLKNREWGKSTTPFLRILYPRYLKNSPDHIAVSVSGNPLPEPRVLSTTLFPDSNRPWINYTLAVMQWGQLIAHDVGLSPSAAEKNLNCCALKNNVPICYPIEVPTNDPFYSKFNQTCINMVRTKSILEKAYNCEEIAYQINAVTHYIDLSHLYGSDDERLASLRHWEGGLLEVHLTKNFREFPKLSNNPAEECSAPYANITCFHSGDNRVNQNTQLTCLQTILLREHNRIAYNLATLNSNWTDEKLFQETRNILIATFQHITYNEWMPFILGDEYMAKHNLKPLTEGYTEYKSDINVGTLSSFMASAFRIFHSLIQGELTMFNETKCPFKNLNVNEGRCPFRSINISDYMHRPGIVTQGNNFDGLLLGLTVENSQTLDRYFTTQMTDMMFHLDYPYGEDLESFDIQRGRDHGIPSYNSLRELCNLTKAQNFTDLENEISEENIRLLESVYENVDDIDSFVGMVMENWVPGTSVGPTALCIIGEQLVRKKVADRFWYEVGNQTHSFSEEQLLEIRKSTFSRLLCDNSDNITTIQPNSFLSASVPGNQIVPCETLSNVNLTKWKV